MSGPAVRGRSLQWDSAGPPLSGPNLSGACSGVTDQLIPGGIAAPPSAGKRPRAKVEVDRWFRPVRAPTRGRGRPRRRPKCLQEDCQHPALGSATSGLRPDWRPRPAPGRLQGWRGGVQNAQLPMQSRFSRSGLGPRWATRSFARGDRNVAIGVVPSGPPRSPKRSSARCAVSARREMVSLRLDRLVRISHQRALNGQYAGPAINSATVAGTTGAGRRPNAAGLATDPQKLQPTTAVHGRPTAGWPQSESDTGRTMCSESGTNGMLRWNSSDPCAGPVEDQRVTAGSGADPPPSAFRSSF